ncbi:MAG: hypothetical protein JW860_08435, partial [Sedimentisphaerales bacterium]|nr:hypothetical protein [Sedimentisphaerales bacterium]
SERPYTDVQSDQLNQDYSAALNTYEISGNAGIAGATMSGLPGDPVSAGDGTYSASVDHGWSGTVTPTLTGYTFTPSERPYTDVQSDQLNQDYTATLNDYTISGNAVVDGVVMSGLPGNPVTSGGGGYSASVPYDWSGSVIPVLEGYTFTPAGRNYFNVTEDYLNENYSADPITFTISGYIMDPNALALEGVYVWADNGGTDDTTEVDGYYEVWVPYNWSGLVLPQKLDYIFNPSYRIYSDVTDHQTDHNYEGLYDYDPTHIDGDLNDDDQVDLNDLDIMGYHWLRSDCIVPQDCDDADIAPLGGDQYVNMLDFSVLAENWLAGFEFETDPPLPNPLTWDQEPAATGMYSIDMTATEATDESGVQYYFHNVTDPNHDSGWQASPYYEDTGLALDTSYTYQVRARDKSPNHNETGYSEERFAATDPDTFPPDPDPMTWAVVPAPSGSGSISMTASMAIDESGVEYYFNNVTDSIHDSGWQDSTMYEDTGLDPNITYTYQVRARDKSSLQNETAYSSQESAKPFGLSPPVEEEEIFYSIAAEDGRMWDNGVTRGFDNKDQEYHETESLRLGDYSNYTYRCILSFDTSYLPEDGDIISVRVEMTRGAKPTLAVDPFIWGGACLIDVVNPCFGSSPDLDNDDWDWPADADAVAEFLGDPGEDNPMTSTEFDENGINAINRTGQTQLRVYFTIPNNGDTNFDYLGFYSGDYIEISMRPRLIITYNTRTPSMTFASVGVDDGRLWDDGDGIGDGANSTDNGNTAMRLGDIMYSGSSLGYQTVLSFETSGLPADKDIVSARLELTRGITSYSVDPFTWGGSCTVDIAAPYFGDSVILTQSDWQAPADAIDIASFPMFDPGSEFMMMSSYFNSEGLTLINKTGTTQFKVFFTVFTNDGASDFVGIYSGDHQNPQKHPRLIVRYSID